jgi:formate hydrogenlyase transcriptional activator
MSTAFAEIAGRTDVPLNGLDRSEFAFGNNVLSLQTRRERRAEFSSRTLVELENTRAHFELEIQPAADRNQIVGNSAALTGVLELVEKVARFDSTILLLGETGTGKELIAQAIHRQSLRRDRPFVKVNCAALPPELIASELFGHEKGAFTSAMRQRIGRFEAANGGTIFLDEIAELSPEIQVSLLRVLQEKEFERVGGNRTIKTDVRGIANE